MDQSHIRSQKENSTLSSDKRRFILCMASHLSNPIRQKYIFGALESAIKAKPDLILLSYSGCNDDFLYRELCSKIKSALPLSIILRHDQKKMQFEHYRELLPYIKQDDIISFMDDDDFLDPMKFSEIRTIFTTHPSVKCIRHDIVGFGNTFSDEDGIYTLSDIAHTKLTRDSNREYVCLNVYGEILHNFFKECECYISSCLYQTDLLFAAYVDSGKYSRVTHKINTPLYYRRITRHKRDYP